MIIFGSYQIFNSSFLAIEEVYSTLTENFQIWFGKYCKPCGNVN